MFLLLLVGALVARMMGSYLTLRVVAVEQVDWSIVVQHHFHQTHTQLLSVVAVLTAQTETTQQSMLVLG
jgi:hypothetical protein